MLLWFSLRAIQRTQYMTDSFINFTTKTNDISLFLVFLLLLLQSLCSVCDSIVWILFIRWTQILQIFQISLNLLLYLITTYLYFIHYSAKSNRGNFEQFVESYPKDIFYSYKKSHWVLDFIEWYDFKAFVNSC